MAFKLTKTLYMAYCQCPKKFYLQAFYPQLQDEGSGTEHLLKQGVEVHELARGLFPGGVEVSSKDLSLALKETRTKIFRKKPTLFESAFFLKHDSLQLYVRNDIIRFHSNKNVELFEVKSSSSIQPHFIQDLAFQTYVLIGAGFNVKTASLILLDSKYIRDTALDPNQMFQVLDVTKEVCEELEVLEERLKHILRIVEDDQNPYIHPGSYCQKPYDCPFKKSICWPEDHSTLNLRKNPLKYAIYLNGYHRLNEIPDEVSKGLPEFCQKQIQVEKTNMPEVEKEKISEIINGLSKEHWYLDFETLNPGIPVFKFTSPFEVVPFQAHIAHFDPQRGTIKDTPFIEIPAEGSIDPTKALAKFLVENIGEKGNVVVYYAPFERNVLLKLAAKHPLYRERLLSIANRLWDLHEIFNKGYFLHPSFKGCTSIKQIAPILAPTYSYRNCQIKNGLEASVQYIQLVKGQITNRYFHQAVDNLTSYCREDVMSMVEIINNLRRLK